MAKAKVKKHFAHKGKNYQPGEDFEGSDQEIKEHAEQGNVEHPSQGPQQHQQQQGGSSQQGPK